MTRTDGLRRGIDGDLYPEPDEHEHECADGWRGEDHTGRPIPCPTCRPHLHRRRLPGGPEILTARPDPHTHS